MSFLPSPSFRSLALGAALLAGASLLVPTPVHSASRRAVRRGVSYTAPSSTAEVENDLSGMLGRRVRSGTWGAIVVSLSRGDTLFSTNPDAPLQPASNMKLFTTALALQTLGPLHRFHTTVLRDGPIDAQGVVHGDLVLRGDGDPSLSGRFINGGPDGAMDLLAQLVEGAGVRRVTGALVADASAFNDSPIPEGWLSRYLQSGYAARVSALSLDENLLWIVVRPSSSGRAAMLSLDPATELPIEAAVRTVPGSSAARIVAQSREDGTVWVRGFIGANAGERRYQIVVENPPLFAAGALRRALAKRGIVVEGHTRTGSTPPNAAQVTTLASPPLDRLLAAMNRESINHYAELLFRDAARAPDDPGSATAGNALLQRFLTEHVGAARGAVYTTDGSGLSVLDRTTPRALVQLLAFAHRAPWGDALHASLPVAGESELLRARMRHTPAEGNLHAKTGTTNDIISLAGYVTARDGELLAFAFIYNGHDRWRARTTMDDMGASLAGLTR